MKAIVSITKKSVYSKFNGLTFDVVELFSDFIVIKLPREGREGETVDVDFNFKEVVIADLQKEVNQTALHVKYSDDYRLSGEGLNLEKLRLENLESYAKKNKIQLSKNTLTSNK